MSEMVCKNASGGPCSFEKRLYEHFGRHPAAGPCPAEAKLTEVERENQRLDTAWPLVKALQRLAVALTICSSCVIVA